MQTVPGFIIGKVYPKAWESFATVLASPRSTVEYRESKCDTDSRRHHGPFLGQKRAVWGCFWWP
jgi:hypothetical protein